MSNELHLNDFDYELPDSLIAEYPLEERAASRLLVLDREGDSIEHRNFYDIKGYLKSGDLLILNDTRVIPARLLGKKPTGGAVELLLVRKHGKGENPTLWEAMAKSSKGLKEGAVIELEDGALGRVVKRNAEEATYMVELTWPHLLATDSLALIEGIGAMPLPPYIKREADVKDSERYQTIFAEHPGAVAAPTAGLHFTASLIDEIKAMGVEVVYITLHTGPGTFMPVRADDIREHRMQAEYYSINEEAFKAVMTAKGDGRRVVAVGSTSVRTLEASVRDGFDHPALSGDTRLFIYPGFEFKIVDAIITNFHLPSSTLIMLVSAFAGRERILDAYSKAVKEGYRFFSYGDAMLIV